MSGVALDLGIIQIHWYGIFYVISFLVSYFYILWILKRFNKNLFKLPISDDKISEFLLDFLFYVVLGVLIGGRLGHVVIYHLNYYLQHPLEVFYVWQGGMSFLGGIVGVAIAIYLFGKKYKLKIIDLFKLGDLIILTLGFGIGLVRIGNFLNQELYGKIIYNILPSVSNETVNFLKDLGIVYIYQSVDTYLRINTNFLEAFFEGFLFFIFINLLFVKDLKKNSRWPGKYVGIFFMYYSIVRFIVEFLREYDKTEFIWIFTKTQRLMFVMFLIGLFFFKLFFNKRPKSEIFK